MAKNRVILIHGMGEHKGGWSAPLQSAFADTAARYEPYRGGRKLTDDLQFEEITYDGELQQVLGRWKSAAGALDAVKSGEQIPSQLTDALTMLAEQEATDSALGRFFWTHLMDPILWCGWQDVRKAVIAFVTAELSRHVTETNAQDVNLHLVAHSLGSSVVHDTLLCMTDGRPEFDPQKGGKRWASLTTFANVSLLLRAWQSPSKLQPKDAFDPCGSRVNPIKDGLLNRFFDVAHASDPFLWPRPMRPAWQHAGYELLPTRRWLRAKDVHTVELAVADPDVARPLLRTWLGNGTLGSKDEQSAARQAHATAFPQEMPTFDDLRGAAGGNHGWNLEEIARYLIAVGRSLQKEGWQ